MLRLRPLRLTDEAEFRAGQEEMVAEGRGFGIAFDAGASWDAYLKTLEDYRKGVNLPERFVPSTFLVGDVGGKIVGRTSIRHQLNDVLRHRGGHVGYAVLPAYRRRGYATEMLRQSLIIVRSVGVDRVLVTCDDDNIGSIKVIEACGGQLENVVTVGDSPTPLRRYWID